ncbi:hypothetical protein PMIN05_011308 [Paraphaeosphaeria minitans]
MSTEELIRMTVLASCLSEDGFNKYRAYEYGPLATHLTPFKYHTASEQNALGRKMFEATRRSPPSYAGMGDFWVRKYEDFEAAFLDPY